MDTTAHSSLYVLWPNKQTLAGIRKKSMFHQYISAQHLRERYELLDFKKYSTQSCLSEFFTFPCCPLSLLLRRGHTWPEGKLTQCLMLTGQSSRGNAVKAITQTPPLHLGIGHSHFRTETISRFNLVFFLPLSPSGCCTEGVKLYSEVFQKKGKVF